MSNCLRGLTGMIVAILAAAAPAFAGPAVEVITNPEQQSARLDRATLRAIFLMRVRQWPDGTPVHVFVMPGDTEVHDQFARELLGTYPYVLERTWDRMVFTGTGLAPEVVRSKNEMREKVRTTRGAIGYQLTPGESHDRR
jgi:ABC-type phosphate transport system substrate-binding protein